MGSDPPAPLRPPAGPAELCRCQSPRGGCLRADATRLRSARRARRSAEARLTVAAIAQVRPDDVLLREAEDPQTTSPHRGVYDDARVHHHLRTLEETNPAARGGEEAEVKRSCVGPHLSRAAEAAVLAPDVAVGRPVLQEPAVGRFVLPADVAGVLPQEFHLVAGVAGVPQRVPQVLAGTRDGFDSL